MDPPQDPDELQRLRADLKVAKKQLQKRDRFRQRVFANITHELKTPLALMLTPIELLLGGDVGELTDDQRRTLRTSFRHGLKLLKMIGDILDLSRLAESHLRIKVADADLVPYLDGLIEQVQPLAHRRRIDLAFDTGEAPCVVWCDLEQLERVFVNLLSNALKFTPQGGHIRVVLTDDGDVVQISVQDDGPGLSAADAERVFDRFYQADMGGARRHGGVGIGLALSRELVRLHGGKIWVESAAGQGSTFVVRLPKDYDHFDPDALARDSLGPDDPRERPAVDLDAEDWSGRFTLRDDFRLLDIDEVTERRVVERDVEEGRHAHTVLVVEDNPDVIKLIHVALRHEFRIMAAPDGRVGLKLAQQGLPDLIITDLMMPEMDGLELTRRVRAESLTRHIPIVMLTARDEMEDRVAGLKTGVNAYLAKPFSPRELRTSVHNLLKTQHATADILLDRRMDSLEIVAGGLAHEINNPLSYINNAVSILQSSMDELLDLAHTTAGRDATEMEADRMATLRQRNAKMFRSAGVGVHRIGETVELMRKYAREGYTRDLRPHDLFAAVEDVLAVIAPALDDEVHIATGFRGDGNAECVPDEINQALTNLLENAIQATAEQGGSVRIQGFQEGSEVVIEIQDDGPGIPPEIRDRIFTPFFTTKDPGRGMGLGLTIARRVVRNLGGTLSVHSVPAERTTFTLRVPRKASPLQEDASGSFPEAT